MINLVVSRAHRILKPISQYNHLFGQDIKNISVLKDLPLLEGESLIGFYENSPGIKEDIIVITDQGLFIFTKKSWSHIRFDDILRVNTPGGKLDRSGIDLYLKFNQIINIPIKGGQGKFDDRYEFLRFLNRVLSDLRRHKQ